MENRENVTKAPRSVTFKRDISRARTPSFGGMSRLSRVTNQRDKSVTFGGRIVTVTLGPEGRRHRHARARLER